MNKSVPQRCVLLTGATGFLGAQIARRLLKEPDLTIIALVRADNLAAAAQRLSRAWWDCPELNTSLSSLPTLSPSGREGREERVEILYGDITLPHLGLDEPGYLQLAQRITHIIHAAADLRINAALDELRKTNVQGTANLLELAHLAYRDHGLERFAHISTAYVTGQRSGAVFEADLTDKYGFSSAYEQSKYEGECLVQAAKSEFPVSVFRPGMIVGDSASGEIHTFNTIYFPLRLYLSGKFRIIPLNPKSPVNLVPVDYVADAVVRLTFLPEAKGLNFHLTAPTASMPKTGELVDSVRTWAHEKFGLRLPRPVMVKLPLPKKQYRADTGLQSSSRKHLWRKLFGSNISSLITLLPYFNEQKQFDRKNVDRLMGEYPMKWREFLPNLLAYAADKGFMHQTERTVHEQLLVRLKSKRRPIHYYDIIDEKVIARSGKEISQEILSAAGALTALGIRPGERVAIVGLNSTRYLALDAAIGLVGAVSVPLYYTSPAAEIDHILSASGARLLLVGAPKILETLDEIATNLPVISFCRESVPHKARREVTSWEKFLVLGADYHLPHQAPVRFDDLATLRYSSGTTGQPKGVSFQHHHLRWMGQTMASLLPLGFQKRKANYISFLPMNHVVEGILTTYAPFYLPMAVNIYFLENIKDIRQALVRIRPDIFFSVPRIFERIWESVEQNPLGQHYLRLPKGLWKRAVGALLRWQTLRKAGLNRCSQLLTGSAPCSNTLMQNFRSLGIEIHNAYGLSEAPLVSINQLGANRLGTVGEPLPQTEIRIAEDGEVLVRGPQVMAGYFEDKASEKIVQPFRDGWLLTGDLGFITPDGSLILQGRKKELIKTSYGKYVQPLKVESLLREIPGVVEAMLVGEQRPYCTALLWVHEPALRADAGQQIDAMIQQINHNLSHPEQIKRWAVLANDLSTEAGTLTANLKLKRQVVFTKLDGVVNSLYNGMNPVQSVLHFGTEEKN